MTTATVQLNVTGNATQQLARIQKQVETLGKTFTNLKNILGGFAIVGFVNNTLKLADAMSDVAKATGLTSTSVLAFSEAVRDNGGTTEDGIAALNNFVLSLDAAKTTSKEARDAFLQLGVSQKDLQTLSNQDILDKTLEGFSKIKNEGKAGSLSLEIFKKSLKGTEIAAINAGYQINKVVDAKYAGAIKAGGDAYDSLGRNVGELRKAILSLLEPLNKVVASITISANAFEFLIKSIISAVGAFYLLKGILKAGALAAGIAEVGSLKEALGGIGDKIVDIAKGLSGGKILSSLKTLGKFLYSATLEPLVQIVRMWGRVITGAERAASVMGAVGGTIALIVKGLLRLGLVITVLTSLYQGLKFLNETVFKSEYIKSFTDNVDGLIDKMAELVGLKEKFDASKPLVIQTGDVGVAPEEGILGHIQKRRQEYNQELTDLYSSQKKGITDITDSYNKQNQELLQTVNLERLYIGMSNDEVEIQQALTDIYNRNTKAIEDLQERKAALTDQEIRAGLGDLIQKQIDALEKSLIADQKNTRAALENLQARKNAQNEVLKQTELMKQQLTDDAAIKALQDQIALIQLYGDELENANIALEVTQSLEQALLELRKQELDLIARKGQLTDEQFQREMAQIEALRQAAYKKAGDEIDAKTQVKEAQRIADEDASLGVKKYIDELEKSTTPAKQALESVQSVFNNMDDALTTFVRTGKFKFKDFALSVIQDLLLIQAKAAMVAVFKGILKGLGIFGFAEGGNVKGGMPIIVGEKGPELFVPPSSGKIVPNNQLGGATSGNGGGGGPVTNNFITNNINAVDAKSVAQLFAENRRTLLGSVKMAEREMPYMAR